MYNKTSPNCNGTTEEVVIKLASENLVNSLYYRDEGNMNIVVSLFANENDEKRVIRFKKIPACDKSKSNDNQHRNELVSFVGFEELLLKYFRNSDLFTVVPKIVYLDGDVNALNKFLMRARPTARQNKIIGSHYGLLYRDVAFLPKQIYTGKAVNGELKDSSSVCIEIKAKQGYLMDDDDVCGVKKCRFCYFQYLKLKNKRIRSISSYCPIDLFSGKPERMNRAIEGLLENPQNNLKMFLDGKMIYNEFSKDKRSFTRVLSSLFPETSTLEKQETLFVNLIRQILLKDFKDCDSLADVCSTYKDQRSLHERSCAADISYSELPWNCILSSILDAQMLVKNNFDEMEIYDKRDDCESNDETVLQNYKIGSTALDCSIMITIKKINGHADVRKTLIHENHQMTMEGTTQLFAANATIVDLDMKKDSIAHFRKYKKQHHESKQAYMNFIESSRNETKE